MGALLLATVAAIAASAQAVDALPAGYHNASDYGIKCDAVSDDSKAFNAITSNGAGGNGGICNGETIVFPPNASCVMNARIWYPHPPCLRFQFNGAFFDFSHMAKPTVMTVLVQQLTGGPIDYTNVRYPVEHLSIVGPGPGTNTVCFQLNDNHVTLRDPSLQYCGTGLEFGNYAFANDIYSPSIFNNNIGVLIAPNRTDAGEQLNFHGGSIFNNHSNVVNQGGEMNFTGTAFDYPTMVQVVNTGAAVTSIYQSHVENGALAMGVEFDNGTYTIPGTGGCSAYTSFDLHDSRIVVIKGTTSVPALIQNDGYPPCGGSGAYSKIQNVKLSGINPTIIGNNRAQVSLCGNTNLALGGTLNNIKNVGTCP